MLAKCLLHSANIYSKNSDTGKEVCSCLSWPCAYQQSWNCSENSICVWPLLRLSFGFTVALKSAVCPSANLFKRLSHQQEN